MVVVPWRGGCPYRERAWGWLRGRHEQVVVGECQEGPWVKANAVADAVARCTADIVAIVDADVWCDGLDEAVRMVEQGWAWAVPHGNVYRLTAEATERVLAGEEFSEQLPLTQRPYRGFVGGGIVVLPRKTYLDVPLDPRFQGWGQEDASWALALRSLAGRPWRGSYPLWHLWHPPQERENRQIGSQANADLWHRYMQSRVPDEMRELIEEAKEASWLFSSNSTVRESANSSAPTG